MKVLFFDLETTDLAANFGRLLCASFLPLDDDKVTTFRRDAKPFKASKVTDDGKLALAIKQQLESADIIVSWNGMMFDVPFLNARLIASGHSPVRVGEKHPTTHLDLMYYSRGVSLKLNSSKLDTVSKFLNTQAKTPLDATTWAEAASGDKAALDQVVEHCEADVRVLRDVFWHLAPLIKKVTFTLSEVYHVLPQIPSRR